MKGPFKSFAPATIGNLGPGYDIFGVAINDLGDGVIATLNRKNKGVQLKTIYNNPGLPTDKKNVVVHVGNHLLEIINKFAKSIRGIDAILYKQMSLETGMGSSASSAVASAVAINEFVTCPFKKSSKELLSSIRTGEAMVTNSKIGHPDNVFPSLLGGFVFIYNSENNKFVKIDVSSDIYFSIISPNFSVNTSKARKALDSIPYNIDRLTYITSCALKNYYFGNNLGIKNSRLESVLKDGGDIQLVQKYIRGAFNVFDGFRFNDLEMLGKGVMADEIITPVRTKYISGYEHVKKSALNAGAYGVSISGSGPAMFAISNKKNAYDIGEAMQKAFADINIGSKYRVSTVNNEGATVERCD